MKRINCYRRLASLFLMLVSIGLIQGQQNRLMYPLHNVPESNHLNPAVPMPCGWVIGLPVVSSFHVNVGNNFTTANQLLSSQGNGHYLFDYYKIEPQLHRRNFMDTEFQTQWLAIGLNRGDWSYFFTITEKNNLATTVPKDMAQLALHGNSEFISDNAVLKGLGIYFTHYREYGLSISKKTEGGSFIGVRAKLLFGKLNVSSKKFNYKLSTAEPTYNLLVEGEVKVKTSGPYYAEVIDGEFGEVIQEDISPLNLLMNGRNPGAAFDLGFILPLNEQLTFSASVIDLGFITWNSNVHNYQSSGSFFYEGVVDNNVSGNYWDNLLQDFYDAMQVEADSKSYVTFLPPNVSAGIQYQVSRVFSTGALADIKAYRTKLLTGITVNGQLEPIQNVKLVSSFTYQYHTLNNIGFGIVAGKNPLQFYLISDNINGFFWPYGARNVNLRFGINIIPGCNSKDKNVSSRHGAGIHSLRGTCGWIKEPARRRKR